MIKEYYPMAWNKPGDKDNNNPWGRKSGEQGPPDLDQIFKQFTNKVKQLFGNKTGPGFRRVGVGKNSNFLAVLYWLLYWFCTF